ncbi:hypothetical protein B0A48_08859 [Cryoendolithus antarcticus]|uniref:Transcription initiation factor IIF subunit beta n=1 Tax=Cryoendolithus antarcticus TaxID=1507870 RepID=A0A1V8T4U6_9PEZI|nr:hypothetical protein B0A48_08859 [Cryoendolithus antarcticus]
MAELAIKPEIKIDEAESKSLGELDDFEEDQSLQIPSNRGQSWLTKIPVDLWQQWNTLYKDALPGDRIKIGQIKIWKNDGGAPGEEAELHLNPELEETSEQPQAYNVKISDVHGYNNSVVFGEKDLPGHRNQGFGRNRRLGPKSAGVNKYDRYNNGPTEPYKKHNGYRSVIPKQTVLAAQIASETSIIPIQDASYHKYIDRTLTKPMQNQIRTTLTLGIQRELQPGRQHGLFSTFTTTSKPLNKRSKKNQKEKFVRMTESELLDALYRCFARYTHWPLKALRQELQQPEAFIKAKLEEIGVLIRSGDFAMTYTLKPQYASLLEIKGEEGLVPKDEVAKVESAGDTEGTGAESDDEDDFGEMEDVKMD